MRVMTAYCTDKGNVKPVNQDALLIKTATVGNCNVAFFCVCDGLGGLTMGERASAHVVKHFSQWFEHDMQTVVTCENRTEKLQEQWELLLENCNQKLGEFGQKNQINLGTTCTALFLCDGEYYITHVGDSRVYEILDQIHQLTGDQTVLAREIALGHIQSQDVENDARASVLLQCIGASKTIEPQFVSGKAREDAVYMLCSDGFRHKITEEEFLDGFHPRHMTDERIMEKQCEYFVELNKSRMERDNITVLLAKVQ